MDYKSTSIKKNLGFPEVIGPKSLRYMKACFLLHAIQAMFLVGHDARFKDCDFPHTAEHGIVPACI
ncbi:MAG: hypothetical protein ACTSU9_07730 [Promethearchaeota archaeon]